MRISDWSSDVCSSDLRATEPGELALDHGEARPGQLDAGGEIHVAEPFADIEMLFRLEAVSLRRTMLALLDIEALVQPVRHLVGRQVRDARQIGRASCRERVGQYV